MNLHKYNTKFQPIIKSSFAVRVKNVLGGPCSGQVPYYADRSLFLVRFIWVVVLQTPKSIKCLKSFSSLKQCTGLFFTPYLYGRGRQIYSPI